MTRQDVYKKKIPDSPGVYYFIGSSNKILYIGRATSLRSRIRSYFDGRLFETRGPWVSLMLERIKKIEFKETGSVLEAIFLEADLIRKFQPPYNTDEKDDKSFNCIVVTDEYFPRVLVVRKKNIDFVSNRLITFNLKLKTIHGPFPHGLQLREAMKILRRIFPWRDNACIPCKLQFFKNNSREECKPCFNRQIGLCPGVCTGEMNSREYKQHIRRLCLFLSGKRKTAVRELQKEMKLHAKNERFEEAAKNKKMLFALSHIQEISLYKKNQYGREKSDGYRIEAYDISHFGGKDIVGAMAVVEGGVEKKEEYRLFKIRGNFGIHETRSLQEVLSRRLNHPEWRKPDLIVVDGNQIQMNAASSSLAKVKLNIPIVAVVKDEKHKPANIFGDEKLVLSHKDEILIANSEAHRFVLQFQKKRRDGLSFPKLPRFNG